MSAQDQDRIDAAADEGRVAGRAELLPEEQEAGVSDPQALAEAVLRDSDERMARGSDGPPGPGVEHRRSEDTVDPIEVDDTA